MAAATSASVVELVGGIARTELLRNPLVVDDHLGTASPPSIDTLVTSLPAYFKVNLSDRTFKLATEVFVDERANFLRLVAQGCSPCLADCYRRNILFNSWKLQWGVMAVNPHLDEWTVGLVISGRLDDITVHFSKRQRRTFTPIHTTFNDPQFATLTDIPNFPTATAHTELANDQARYLHEVSAIEQGRHALVGMHAYCATTLAYFDGATQTMTNLTMIPFVSAVPVTLTDALTMLPKYMKTDGTYLDIITDVCQAEYDNALVYEYPVIDDNYTRSFALNSFEYKWGTAYRNNPDDTPKIPLRLRCHLSCVHVLNFVTPPEFIIRVHTNFEDPFFAPHIPSFDNTQ